MKWQQSISQHSASDSDDDCSDSCQTSMAASSSSSANPGRKRRRGIIEKRRRDRINQSLTELKRLVPAALEKSNSAKLEKAEILQMTVEHLKMVQNNRGLGGNGYVDAYTAQQDAHKIAFDYHAIGFRECAAEVARYLGAVEGIEVPDSARVRLLTHLQMFATQKQSYNHAAQTAAAYTQVPMAAVNSQCWPSYGTTPPATTYTPPATYNYCDPSSKSTDINGTTLLPNSESLRYPFSSQSTSLTSTNTSRSDTTIATTAASGVISGAYNGQYGSYGVNAQPTSYFSAFGTPPTSATAAVVAAAASHHNHPLQNQIQNEGVSSVSSSTSPPTGNHGSALSGSSITASIQGIDGRMNGHDALAANYISNSKPYRPWGAEMASC